MRWPRSRDPAPSGSPRRLAARGGAGGSWGPGAASRGGVGGPPGRGGGPGTGRGFRVGLAGPREPVVELAGGAPEVSRFALRPVSLEDVYFAATRDADEVIDAVPA